MPLGARQLLAYGVTGLPLAALGLPLFVYLPSFYAESAGIAVATVGAVLLGVRLVDVISDPLVGLISDHWPMPAYRRRAVMLLGLPLLLVGIEYLFRPTADPGAAYLLLWSLVAYLGWTLIAIPYNAWGAEVSGDAHVRTQVAASREGMLVVGTLAAIALPTFAGHAGDAKAALDLLAGVLWIALPLAVLATVLLVPEGRRRQRPAPWAQGLALLRDNQSLRRLVLVYVLNGMANGLPATLFLLFVAHVLQAREASGVLLGAYFLAGVLALPIWVALSRRLGKHRSWALSMALACAVFLWAPLLGPGDVWAFLAICVLSGLCLGADLALPASLQADIVELDGRLGGGERAGLFFGLWGMATKLALALAVGLAFPLLDLAGFDPQGANASSALLALALLYGGLPVAIKLAAIALIWNFSLGNAPVRVAPFTTSTPGVPDHAPPVHLDPDDQPPVDRGMQRHEA